MAVNGPTRYLGRRGVVRFLTAGALAAGLTAVWPGGPAASGTVRTRPGPGTARVFAGGVGGPAQGRTVALSLPCGVASHRGHVYFTDSGPSADFRPGFTERSIGAVVRKVNSRTGWMTTVAGVGLPGISGAWRSTIRATC
jgi:hypothetical protein